MEWDKAKEWVRSLNGRGYAGYHDWKLPTLEEAASLLESNKRNDSYIDPIFSNKQGWIWTGDKFEIKGRWDVRFDRFFNCIQSGGVLGGGDWGRIGRHEYVRPVRSVLSKDVEPSYQSGRDTGQVQDKSDARVHYNLGRDYNVLDMHKEAIESYKQAIRIDPDHVEAHNNLGVAYGELGRYQEAIESYKQAIRIDPDHAEAHNNLGNAYLQLNDRDSAPADLSLPQAPIAIVKQEPEPVVNKWTLRIISYSNTKKHLKQAANLAKAIKNMTGYNTFLAKIGKEIVVCAGRFNLEDSSELREALKVISKLEYEGKRQFESSYAIQIK
jgi:tetratricopeptide (TPR) repeat protein